MRIAFLVGTFPTLSETFVLNQITGLMDRGHTVDIFAWKRGDTRIVHPDVRTYGLMDRARFPASQTRMRVARPFSAAKLIVTSFPKNPLGVLRSMNVFQYGKQAASCWMLRQAAPFLGRPEYDIIQCHFGMLGTCAARLKSLGVLKGRIVVMFHGADIRWGNQEGADVYRQIMNRDTYVLSISGYNRRNLVKFGFDPANIIDHPVGIDMRKFSFRRRGGNRPRPGEDIFVEILTVARLTSDKGLEYGIRAIKEVLMRVPSRGIHYTIIGEGDQRGELESLVAKLNLGSVVTLAGEHDHSHVRRQMRHTDLFLLPSRNEALPVSLMEAQACGLPVVASAVGSVHEIVRDGESGFLVPPGDVQALADRLTYLIDHPRAWLPMGRAGRAHVEARYDINKLNDRLVRIYEALLQGNDAVRAMSGMRET